MTTRQITSGNRAAIITSNDEAGPFSCRIWVNVRDGLAHADATLVSAKRKTLAGALKWATRELAASSWVQHFPLA